MSTTTDKKAKMLERVRALLAKADGTTFPAEADSFRAKADELMTLFAIEQWQIDAAQDGTTVRAMPVKREFNIDWWYDYASERASDLWSLFSAVADHCRCVVATRGQKYRALPVIGLDSDLDYLDMLFTHLMLDLGRQLEPKPDASKTLAENAYALRRAGLQRTRITELMYNACTASGDPLFPELHVEDCETYEDLHYNTRRAGKLVAPEKLVQGKLRRVADKYAEDNGLDKTTTVHPVTWQRSFSQGFVSEVRQRMRVMRREQERPSDGPSVALAIRDIKQQAMDVYNEMFPPPPPPECKEPGCTQRPVYMGYCEEHCKAHNIKIPKSRALGRMREVTFSNVAYGAGTTAGKKANLSAHPSKGVGGKRGQLDR
jgi:hypothetical protein